jgi:hypothetical protein
MGNFFSRVLPSSGPYTLFTGITGPDGKLTEQRHYNGLVSHEALEKQIQDLSTRPLNVFYAVGSYAGPNRKDPIAKRVVFLDLDGKDFDGSIPNALRALTRFVDATGLPPPSIYVHSGRGVHVYWCLDRDVPVAEWEAVADALKAKCKELEFPADPSATADPARVLRVPGTLNRKGATPLPCRVLSDNGSTYPLERISQQLGIKPLAGSKAKLAALAKNDDLYTKPQYKDLKADDVRAMLESIDLPQLNSRDDWITILCGIQDWGKKSEESWEIFHEWCKTQPGYSDVGTVRREWDSFSPGGGVTVGTLVKRALDAGYVPPGTPEPVAPASLSEQLDATPSVGDDEPRVERGVTADPLMISAQHAVNQLGKVRFDRDTAVQFLANEFVLVTEQEGIYYSMTTRQALTTRVIDDLLTRYMPINSNGVPLEASKIMRRFGVRHSVQALGFHPAAGSIFDEGGKAYVNQYTPPEDFLPATVAETALLDDFWKYMFPTKEDQPFSDYLKQVFAHLVLHPEVKIDSAPLIISPEFGTGKTTLAYEIPRRLVGESNSQMVGNKTLQGAYSSYINGRKFLHFDEIHINGRWDSDATANALKSLVAGSTVEVHPKFMSPFNIRNRLWISATSNYEDAMSLPNEGERRWAVYAHAPTRVWTSKSQKDAYFAALYKWLNSARAAGVLRWYFAQVSLTGFNPSSPPPLTQAKIRMVGKSQIKEVRIIQDATQYGEAPFDRDLVTNAAAKQYLHAQTSKTYSDYEVREFLRRALPDAVHLPQLRVGSAHARPLCWRNKTKWMDPACDKDEIKKELTA